jgi:hypothetical protein
MSEAKPTSEDLIKMISKMDQKEVMKTLSQVAFPWELDQLNKMNGKDIRYVRLGVTGEKVCSGQKTQRAMDEADTFLRGMNFVLLEEYKS